MQYVFFTSSVIQVDVVVVSVGNVELLINQTLPIPEHIELLLGRFLKVQIKHIVAIKQDFLNSLTEPEYS